jgi:hypothetical protein
MFVYQNTHLAISEMDNLFPQQSGDAASAKAEEALHSHMIIGFEEALSLGMPPMEALSHVLCWVATEMARLNAGQQRAEAPIFSGGLKTR